MARLPLAEREPESFPGHALAVGQGMAFIASFHGIRLIDVRDPTTPVELGTVTTPGEAWAVAIDGNVLSVADGAGGLLLLDAGGPSRPVPEPRNDMRRLWLPYCVNSQS